MEIKSSVYINSNTLDDFYHCKADATLKGYAQKDNWNSFVDIKSSN